MKEHLNWIEPNSGESEVALTSLRLTQVDRVRQLIRHELFLQAAGGADQHETFEEADDFEMDDGDEWTSPYETDFEPPSETVVEHPAPAPNPPPAPVVPPATNVGDGS